MSLQEAPKIMVAHAWSTDQSNNYTFPTDKKWCPRAGTAGGEAWYKEVVRGAKIIGPEVLDALHHDRPTRASVQAAKGVLTHLNRVCL